MRYDTVIQEGWDVVGSSGEKLGEVAQVTNTFFVVSKGFFFPTDRYIPFSAIDAVNDGKVALNLTKDEIDARGWDNVDSIRNAASTPPDTYPAGTTQAGYEVDRTGPVGSDYDVEPVGTRAPEDETARDNDQVIETATGADIQLREERLRGTSRAAKSGSVEIGKDVEAKRETVDAPTSHEEVDVEYHPYHAPRAASRKIDEEEIRVPVQEEHAEAEEKTVATGEVNVNKRRVEGTERVTGEVRKEQPQIERQGSVDVNVEDHDIDEHP